MWILNFIPDVILQAITHGLFVLSLIGIIASYFISNIPQIGAYSTIVRITSVIIFVVCVFIEGMFYKDFQWEERVAELKQKLEYAEQQSKEVNTVIEYKYKDRIKKITEVQVVVEEKIKLVENKINAECKITPEVIEILNEATRVSDKP